MWLHYEYQSQVKRFNLSTQQMVVLTDKEVNVIRATLMYDDANFTYDDIDNLIALMMPNCCTSYYDEFYLKCTYSKCYKDRWRTKLNALTQFANKCESFGCLGLFHNLVELLMNFQPYVIQVNEYYEALEQEKLLQEAYNIINN